MTKALLVKMLSMAAAATAVAAASPASATGSWGTGARTAAAAGSQPTVVTSVRTGHHASYDRMVVTFRGPVPGWDVRYVSAVHADPSDKVVRLEGNARLRVVLRPTSTVTHAPQGTWTPHLAEIRQVKGAGDVEGVTSYGVGLAAKRAFHVFTLTGPSRLVIDVRLP